MNYEEALKKRWKARTDLIWLCNNVLGLKKVSQELNGEMVKRMYHFPKPKTWEEMKAHDKWDPSEGWQYEPLIYDKSRLPGKLPDPSRMPGKRRTLLLDSRGFYKTSINVEAHCVQWILNYPDITMLLFQGGLDLATQFLMQTKQHFWTNEIMQELFPELCVPITSKEFGTRQQFTIPGRTKGYIREQPTMKATSIERAGAGQHVEVIKYSDIVNESNSGNKEICKKIYDTFIVSRNLLVSPIYWIDVEGTRWHGSDAYGEIIEEEKDIQRVNKVWLVDGVPYLRKSDAEVKGKESKKVPIEQHDYYIPQPDKRAYNVYINICYKLKDADKRKYDYDDMLVNLEKQWARDERGRPLSRHPTEYPSEDLEAERKSNKFQFGCQKLNNPSAGSDEEIKFPVNDQYPRLIKISDYRQNVKGRISYYDIAVDTANTISRRSDYSCILAGGFDGYGRCYIPEVIHGKFQEEELADHILDMCRRYRPRRLLMEKDRGSAGIRVWLNRKMQLRGEHFEIFDVPIMNQNSKTEKIAKTLRPWYVSGDLVFVVPVDSAGDAIVSPQIKHLMIECERFPRWHDDMLDTLSTLFYQKDWNGRNSERTNAMAGEHDGDSRKKMEEIMRKKALMHHLQIVDAYDEQEQTQSMQIYDPWQSMLGGL